MVELIFSASVTAPMASAQSRIVPMLSRTNVANLPMPAKIPGSGEATPFSPGSVGP
jgi:hypothetical protein